jgi:hypothetical protein
MKAGFVSCHACHRHRMEVPRYQYICLAEDLANHKVDFSSPYPSNAALCILMNLSPFPSFIGNCLLLGKFWDFPPTSFSGP